MLGGFKLPYHLLSAHSGVKVKDRFHPEIEHDQYTRPSENTRKIIQSSGGKPGSSVLRSYWSGCSAVCSSSMLYHEVSFLFPFLGLFSHVDFSLSCRKRYLLLIHFQGSANLCSLLEKLSFPSWKDLLLKWVKQVGQIRAKQDDLSKLRQQKTFVGFLGKDWVDFFGFVDWFLK